MKNNISAVFRIIKQLAYVLTPKQKQASVTVLFALIATSCLELLGVSSIYPLLQLMMNPEGVRDKWYIGWIYELIPQIEYKQVLLVFCMAIIFIFLIKNGLAIFFSYLQYRFATTFQKEASTDMLRKYMHRPYEFFVNTNSAFISRGITTDISSVYLIVLNLFQAVGELLTVVMIAVFLVSVDAMMALASLLLASLCFLLTVGVFKGKLKRAGLRARDASVRVNKHFGHTLGGIKDIFVLDRRSMFVNRYEELSEELGKCNLVSGVIGACPDRIMEGICLSGFMAIVCIRLMLDGNVASFIPVLGSFAMGSFKVLPSFSKLSSRINAMVYNQFGLQECYDNMKEAKRIEEEEKRQGIEREEDFSDSLNEADALQFKKSIKIEDISWRYKNRTEDVLSGLTLEIHKGESVAFVGSSGAGKTTLADIIMGLFKPYSGSLTMDGYDIFKYSHSWHKQIGYVPQAVFLIDDTIRANVAFGLGKEHISDERVWNALEQAQLKEFVEKCPNGLDTIVGERGVRFSGGQRQRIALARALYEEPEILVLDEATSALDSETEAAVMESIERLQGHKTLIIIAHRLTTVKNCDKIYKIEDGIAKETTYAELTSAD